MEKLPLKTRWDSSTTFHIRSVLSLPPAVTALSRLRASILEMPHWWPYRVSTYIISSRFHIFTVLSDEELKISKYNI